MSSNVFKKEFIDPNQPPGSPTRPYDAIEVIPESRLIRDISRLLSSAAPTQDLPPTTSHQYKQTTRSRPARNKTRRVIQSSSSRNAPSTSSRYTQSDRALPPPISPIEALASVAAFQAHSPTFGSPPNFYNSSYGGQHVQISPNLTTYPAPQWRAGQWDEYHEAVEERPAKRARSEVMPSPLQTSPNPNFGNGVRPATSYNSGWGYNVELSIDRGQRMAGYSPSFDSRAFAQPNPAEEAELLLNFSRGGSVSSMNGNHAQAPKPNPLPEPSHNAPPPPLPPFPCIVPDRGFKEIDKAHQSKNSSHVVLPPSSQLKDTYDSSGPSIKTSFETHTPPEDTAGPPDPLNMNSDVLQVDDDSMAGSSTQWQNGSHELSVVEELKNEHILQFTQLQSPQSLLAEATEGQTPPSLSAHILPPLPEMKNQSTVAEKSQSLWRRRNSEARPENEARLANINVRTRTFSVPPDNSMTILAGEGASRLEPMDKAMEESIEGNLQTPIPAALPSSSSSSLHEQGIVCPTCNFAADSMSHKVNWLQCDGCDRWYHAACAGYTENDTRRIDKYYCKSCKPKFGSTTWKRKSTRVHTTVDYAGLNEGVLRTSDDNPEHHYIRSIKEGTIPLIPETFPRMAPEEISADFFEKGHGFEEPIVIPAALNPRPNFPGKDWPFGMDNIAVTDFGAKSAQGVPATDESEMVPDDGQDKLDMVIPQGLTVRRVSELYGPKYEIPVIDVKAQEGDRKKWTVERWADYYEATAGSAGDRIIRNVISLECSHTPLGRLIRRPKIVRDLDLQDSVWPKTENRKAVSFYVLMSVADCYTDFHIDFGGSSVYYHVLKGKKTFFFIPPTTSNLQKYQEWNMMASQNWTWLPGQTKSKECYRVDLSAGDTMLIPSGWIHAVWTPEDSLVIGGNFLTRLHFSMQFKVTEVERVNKTSPKFKYPKFQKVMWYTVLQYLEEDPVPESVRELLLGGNLFSRKEHVYRQFNKFGHNSDPGPENYNARYYGQAELDGLPDMVNYIFRTVMIFMDRLEGITKETRKAVSDSIPKGRGEPLELAKSFAMWVAWKRGNESIPEWVHPGNIVPTRPEEVPEKKLSDAQFKKLRGRTAVNTPDRQLPAAKLKVSNAPALPPAPPIDSAALTSTPKTSSLGPRRTACDACRRRKMRCKHTESGSIQNGESSGQSSQLQDISPPASMSGATFAPTFIAATSPQFVHETEATLTRPRIDSTGTSDGAKQLSETPDGKKGRSKACQSCRNSKRRCIHDEFGNIDPVKQNEPVIPRGPTRPKNKVHPTTDSSAMKRAKRETNNDMMDVFNTDTGLGITAPEPASSLDQRMDTAMYDTVNMPGDHAEEPAFDSDAWLNERAMETTESLYDSMINHTSPPTNSASYPHEAQMTDAEVPPPEAQDVSRYSALEAMAADALLDPALLDEPVKQTDSEPVRNVEVVEEEVVLQQNEHDDIEPEVQVHEWPASAEKHVEVHVEGLATEHPEEQANEYVNISAEIPAEEHAEEPQKCAQIPTEEHAETSTEEYPEVQAEGQVERQTGGHLEEQAKDHPKVQTDAHSEAQVVEPAEVRVEGHSNEMEVQQPEPQEIMHMVDADKLPKDVKGNVTVDLVDPQLSEPMDIDITPETMALDVQSPSSVLSKAPSSPMVTNGIEAPVTPGAPSADVNDPTNTAASGNAAIFSTESGQSKRHSSRQSKPVDRFSIELGSKRVEKVKPTPTVNGTSKSTSPESARKPARSKTPAETPVKQKAAKMEAKESPIVAATLLVPEADEDTMKLIEQIRQEDLGLRRRRAS